MHVSLLPVVMFLLKYKILIDSDNFVVDIFPYCVYNT